LAAGHAARWAALVEAVADGFASVVSCGMERHETPERLSDATLATILHFHATINTYLM